ncbi:MAG: 5-oxoprolinase subunit C family protein [Candidatus Dormibacteraceae bacterium]
MSTTIQDLGRHGCLQKGIPTGGAADLFSHQLANAIVGNDAFAATLEMMLLGATLEVLQPFELAIAGADMSFQVNGRDSEMGRVTRVAGGDVLTFSKARRGCFGYLAIRGGFDGTVALGSRSTYVAGRLGGHFGRALRKGDVLEVLDARGTGRFVATEELLEWPLRREPLRFVRGPQEEYFSDSAYRVLSRDPFTVTPRSNRVAHRLTGPALEIEAIPRTGDTGSGPTDIVEDGNAVGAIQIAGGVEPICMGRDCPTTGAYAKIGCIITPDVSRLAQLQPGDSVRFEEISVDAAHEAWRGAKRLIGSFSS